jgi:hypothetical protein
MTLSPQGYAASPAGDAGSSPNSGICDTTHQLIKVFVTCSLEFG